MGPLAQAVAEHLEEIGALDPDWDPEDADVALRLAKLRDDTSTEAEAFDLLVVFDLPMSGGPGIGGEDEAALLAELRPEARTSAFNLLRSAAYAACAEQRFSLAKTLTLRLFDVEHLPAHAVSYRLELENVIREFKGAGLASGASLFAQLRSTAPPDPPPPAKVKAVRKLSPKGGAKVRPKVQRVDEDSTLRRLAQSPTVQRAGHKLLDAAADALTDGLTGLFKPKP